MTRDPHITRVPLISGDEYDALSKRSRALLSWRPGERRRIKRGYWRRLRVAVKRALGEVAE